MTLGPKAEAALKDGPQRVLEDLGKYRIYVQETVQDFARRVAMIAVEEERERCARIHEFEESLIDPNEAAAIREGR